MRMLGALLCGASLVLALLAGCQRTTPVAAPEAQERISLRGLLEERELIAGWFGVPANAVSLIGDANHGVPGGDRDWTVRMPSGGDGRAVSIMVITKGGLPAYIQGPFAVPEAGDMAPPSAPWDSFAGEQRAAAEVACIAVARIAGLPVRVTQVAGVRAHDSEFAVVLRLSEEPWNELGEVRVSVMPERRVREITFGLNR